MEYCVRAPLYKHRPVAVSQRNTHWMATAEHNEAKSESAEGRPLRETALESQRDKADGQTPNLIVLQNEHTGENAGGNIAEGCALTG